MSPVGVVGGFFVGLANGAFGGLGVVFAEEVGLSITGIALFMSASLVGGALAQLPLGRFSDRTDRRKVIIGVCAFAALMGGLLALLGEARQSGQMLGIEVGSEAFSPWVLIAAATLFGGAIYSQYSLCVAHTNDFVGREEFIEASSGLLLTWAIGASIGPLLGAFAIDLVGAAGLFAYTAARARRLRAVHVLSDGATRCRAAGGARTLRRRRTPVAHHAGRGGARSPRARTAGSRRRGAFRRSLRYCPAFRRERISAHRARPDRGCSPAALCENLLGTSADAVPVRSTAGGRNAGRSKAQQKAAGAALAAKRGERPRSKLKGASKEMVESMTEQQLEDMASTPRKGKPERASKKR